MHYEIPLALTFHALSSGEELVDNTTGLTNKQKSSHAELFYQHSP